MTEVLHLPDNLILLEEIGQSPREVKAVAGVGKVEPSMPTARGRGRGPRQATHKESPRGLMTAAVQSTSACDRRQKASAIRYSIDALLASAFPSHSREYRYFDASMQSLAYPTSLASLSSIHEP